MTNKLGCFGSIIYHDAEHRRCKACPFLAECSQEVAENKEKLTSWYKTLTTTSKSARKTRKMGSVGIAPSVKATRTPSTAATSTVAMQNDDGVATTTLNKKPREFVERWIQKGIKFKAYKDNINGFELCGNKFAAVAMQFFMNNPTVTKAALIEELIAKCGSRGQGWGMGTAASHAGIVLESFLFLGIIVQSGGNYHLR